MANKGRGGLGTAGFATVVVILAAMFAQPRKAGADERLEGSGQGSHTTNTTRGSVTPARGHLARSPSQIPASGWVDIVKRVFAEVSENRLMAEAAGITFYTLLAIFPAIAALVSLYGLFADPATVQDNLNAVSGFVPQGGMDILSDQVKRLTANGNKSLGFGFVLGLAISLWSAHAAVAAVFDSLNVVYAEHEKRGFVFRTALTLGFTLGGLVFVILVMTSVVVLPVVLKFVGLDSAADLLLRLARWPVLMLVLVTFLSVIYRYGPSRQRARWRWVTWGSLIAAIIWVIASAGFSYYVANFGSYNATYGSLGAAVGFMTWIWISALIVLIGGQFNAEMELQTARDTTTGRPLPMGKRGAEKADNVALA